MKKARRFPSFFHFYSKQTIFNTKLFILLVLNTKNRVHAPKVLRIRSSISHAPVLRISCNISTVKTMQIIVRRKILNLRIFLKRRGKKKANGANAARFPAIFITNALSETVPEKMPETKSNTVLKGIRFTDVERYSAKLSFVITKKAEMPMRPKYLSNSTRLVKR